MPRTPIGWALTLAVPALAIAIALQLGGGARTDRDASARAAAICGNAASDLADLPQSPHGLAEGLEIEHGVLAIFGREVAQLQRIAPELGKSFQSGVAEDQALYEGLSSMMARPDFVKLSLTLPGHPELVPAWLKRWTDREQALVAEAGARFSEAGVSACAKSQG